MNVDAISLSVGAGIALASALLCRACLCLGKENRALLDRPPLGFRLLWWPLRLLEPILYAQLTINKRKGIERRLKNAGAEFRLSASQFLAGKFLTALLAAIVMWFLTRSLGSIVPGSSAMMSVVCGALAYWYPDLWLREAALRRQNDILGNLPFTLDIITLSVEAGNNLTGGLTQAVQRATHSELRSELLRVLRDVRAGRTRADALRDMAERIGSAPVSHIIGSLIQAERSGSSLGPLLREQARQLRDERFRRAEKQAMEAPVKLLGPLILFIFPTTFLVLGFLVLSKAMQEGLIDWWPLVWAYHWPG